MARSMECPFCHATIIGKTEVELGWNYSAHISQCPSNPANQED